MYYMRINKNLVHQVGDQTKVFIPVMTRKSVTLLAAYGYKKKLRGLSPRANYTDRAAAAGRRS